MNCPACGKQLSQMVVGGVTVDVCQSGCAGLWFDNFELKKFDEPHESAGEALLEIERDNSVEVDQDKRRNCPKCDKVMMRHFFSVRKQVAVDECPSCAGIWLDMGELGLIRKQFETEEEQGKAAAEYYDEVFGTELSAMKAKRKEESGKVRRFANMFRFICPSYYIPGKQKWGAF